MDILLITLQLVLGVVGLHFGAEWLVSGSSRLALSMNVKPLVIGLTVVAFGTSTPELVVSLTGALQGADDISVGNVIGSNIANIGLVLGLSASLRPIEVEPVIFRRDLPLMFFVAALVGVLPLVGLVVHPESGYMLQRWMGLLLVAVLGAFLWLMFRGAHSGTKAPRMQHGRRLMLIMLTVVGVGALVAGGKLFVDGAVLAAHALEIPEYVIGLTVVAVGTSLPELATSVIAIIRNHGAISLGNVIGSNIYNICMVLGLVALIKPIAIDDHIMRSDVIVMLVFSAAVAGLAWRGKKLSRAHGLILLAAYAVYVVSLFAGQA